MILPAEKYFMFSVILKLKQLTWANLLLLKQIIKQFSSSSNNKTTKKAANI